MKYEHVSNLNRIAIASWGRKQFRETDEQLKQRKFYYKLRDCGTSFVKGTCLDYKVLTRRCRSAMCCRCSRLWSVKQANSLIKQFPLAKRQDFRFVTIGLGLTTNIEEVYSIFSRYKAELRKAIYRKRSSRKTKLRPWRRLALAGSLEIDCFRASDFVKLGSKKQKQYIEMGFDVENTPADMSVWCVHYHGVLHKGRLSCKDFAALAGNHAHYVHFTELTEGQNVHSAIRTLMRYSSKVRYTTVLANCTRRIWDFDQIEQLAGVVYREKGRQSYKFCIKSQNRK